MQRTTWIVAAAASCALAGFGIWQYAKTQDTLQYRTAAVERGDINVNISATGSPNAVVTVQVGSQISGAIMELYADFNTKVKKGQLIARIDPAPLQAKVDQSQANLDAARANVANGEAAITKANAALRAANAALDAAVAAVKKAQVAAKDAALKAGVRIQLGKERLISKEDVDTAQATSDTAVASQDAAVAQQRAAEDSVKVAEADREVATTQMKAALAQYRQFEAALRATQIDLNHTYIRAPVDGVVVSRRVDVGQTVAASLATPTLFEIAQDLTKMQVDTNVSEADVGRVREGQPANFTVDAYPRQMFQGTVTEIRKAPINVQNVVTYDVVIGVSNPELKLFPGMTANVKILTNQHSQVLKVPNAALRFRPATDTGATQAPAAVRTAGARRAQAGAEQSVWTLDANGKPQKISVTTGDSDGVFTEITASNLKEGDRVILAAAAKGATAPATPTASPGGGRGGRGLGF